MTRAQLPPGYLLAWRTHGALEWSFKSPGGVTLPRPATLVDDLTDFASEAEALAGAWDHYGGRIPEGFTVESLADDQFAAMYQGPSAVWLGKWRATLRRRSSTPTRPRPTGKRRASRVQLSSQSTVAFPSSHCSSPPTTASPQTAAGSVVELDPSAVLDDPLELVLPSPVLALPLELSPPVEVAASPVLGSAPVLPVLVPSPPGSRSAGHAVRARARMAAGRDGRSMPGR